MRAQRVVWILRQKSQRKKDAKCTGETGLRVQSCDIGESEHYLLSARRPYALTPMSCGPKDQNTETKRVALPSFWLASPPLHPSNYPSY